MNCKPGDWAIRVRAPARANIRVGALVRVVRWIGLAYDVKTGEPLEAAWQVEYRGEDTDVWYGTPWAIPDSHLVPLPDAGADAQNELPRVLPRPVEG